MEVFEMRKIIIILLAAVCAVSFVFPDAAWAVPIGKAADITKSSQVFFGRYPQSFSGANGTERPAGMEGVDYIQAPEAKDSNKTKYYLREPIEWRLLQNDGSWLYLTSQKLLDGVKYHARLEDVTWEVSTIRAWLNNYSAGQRGNSAANPGPGSFIGTAFSAGEVSVIAMANTPNRVDPFFGAPVGNDTTDTIFLHS
jgi:hypothetical protein